MPTKAGRVSRRENMNPVMPVFVLLSLLSHLLALINLAKIAATPQPGDAPQDSNSLSVRIYKPSPRAIDPKLPHHELKTKTHRGPAKALTLRPGTRSQSQQALKQPSPKTSNTQQSRITAIELVQKAFSTVPALAKTMEQKDSLAGETVIFDLRFRKKLEQVRHEQTRRSNLANSLEKRPEIEMIGDYGDYFTVRIDGRCWKTPVPDESDPFDVRIVMRDFRCK